MKILLCSGFFLFDSSTDCRVCALTRVDVNQEIATVNKQNVKKMREMKSESANLNDK